MRGVRQDAAGIVPEAVPLLQKIVAAVVADLFDQRAVDVADLADMNRLRDAESLEILTDGESALPRLA